MSALLCVATGPVLADSSADQIAAGQYIAIAANCASCHTADARAPFAGGVAFETAFGTIYSPNITPDPKTGIGSWSATQFRDALKQGLRADGEHLYPVFPYTSYSQMSDTDIDALYAYLMSIQPVSATNSENHLAFPFNQRWLMALWKLMFFKTDPLAAPEDQSEAWQRGRYLVTALGHCGECHSPRNALGATLADHALTGGSYLDQIPGGQTRPWFAVNLTSADDGLGQWSNEELQQYLQYGLNRYATSFGPMNKVIMNSTSQLSEPDLTAMVTYLKSLPAKPADKQPPATNQVSLARGRSLYAVHCATCHLPTGKGDPDTGPALIDNPVVLGADPSSLINVILYGAEIPSTALPIQRTPMDPYEHKLDDEQVADIATYIRNTWGNTGKQVSVDDVLKQR
nr:cytochrome c [Aestuariicella hydrocarbonica]